MSIINKIKSSLGLNPEQDTKTPELDPSVSFINNVINSTRSKINGILQVVQSGLEFLGFAEREQDPIITNESPQPTESEEEVLDPMEEDTSAYKDPETQKKSKIDEVKKKFVELSNSYRQNISDSGKVQMDHPELEIDDELSKLAEASCNDLNQRIVSEINICKRTGKKIDENKFEYHNKEFIKQGISENHAEGAGKAKDILQDLFDSMEHRKALLGDFSKIGIAIKEGVNLRGEPVYHVQVIYDGDKSKWPTEESIKSLEAPEYAAEEIAVPQGNNGTEIVRSLENSQRPVLAAYLSTFNNELGDRAEISINEVETSRLGKNELAYGDFVIQIESDDWQEDFLVLDNPPYLQRKGDNKIFTFREGIVDEIFAPEKTTQMTKEEFEASYGDEPSPDTSEKRELENIGSEK